MRFSCKTEVVKEDCCSFAIDCANQLMIYERGDELNPECFGVKRMQSTEEGGKRKGV
jgi:hypothetical protein